MPHSLTLALLIVIFSSTIEVVGCCITMLEVMDYMLITTFDRVRLLYKAAPGSTDSI